MNEDEPLSVVVVWWRDAHQLVSGWSDSISDVQNRIVLTAGLLLPDAKPEHVCVLQSLDSELNMDAAIAIPVELVYEIKTVGRQINFSREVKRLCGGK